MIVQSDMNCTPHTMNKKKDPENYQSIPNQIASRKENVGNIVIDKLEKSLANTQDEALKSSFRIKAICHLAALGYNGQQIAAQLGISGTRVYKVLKSTSCQQQIEKIQHELYYADPQKMFMSILPKAVRTVKKVMLDKEEKGSTRVMAANSIMDRALGKPTQEIKHEGNAIKELFLALDKKMNPEKLEKDQFIEAEFKEVEENKPKKDDMDSWLDENL